MIGSSVRRLRTKRKILVEVLSFSCLPLRMILVLSSSWFACRFSGLSSRLVEGLQPLLISLCFGGIR